MTLRFPKTALLCTLLAGLIPAAHANLIITPAFDTSITSDPNSGVIEAAINSAIMDFEADFATPITVPIFFQEGGGLGGSEFYYYVQSYTTIYNHMVATNANPAAIAGLTANGGASANNPVNGSPNIVIKSANARALGDNIAPGCHVSGGACVSSGGSIAAYDGIVTLNTSLTFPPQPNNGSYYSLVSVAEHEIAEVLGLGSSLININSSTSGTYNTASGSAPAPEDLFRYNAVTGGARTFGTNCASPTAAYLSYSPSAIAISQFNNGCNGADFGDLASSATPQVQDAYATPGANPTINGSEIAALSAVGYVSAVPEPAMFLPVAGALLFFGLRRR